MAIFEDGKLRGKLGNLVYRTVNGRTVVQSYPRKPKGGYQLTERNTDFGVASKAASRLYGQLKDFALNLTMRSLHNSLNSLLIREFKHLQPAEAVDAWSLVPGSEDVLVGRRAWLDDMMDMEVLMDLEDGKCGVWIPPLELEGSRFTKFRIWGRVRELELAATLLHYDFGTNSASVVARWNSGRFVKSNAPGEVGLNWDLLDGDGVLIDNGLLLGCVGLRMFASETSESYLNTEAFNPFSVVGIWAKA